MNLEISFYLSSASNVSNFCCSCDQGRLLVGFASCAASRPPASSTLSPAPSSSMSHPHLSLASSPWHMLFPLPWRALPGPFCLENSYSSFRSQLNCCSCRIVVLSSFPVRCPCSACPQDLVALSPNAHYASWLVSSPGL